MSYGLLWSNLVAYSAQVLALVAAGALLQLALRARQPRAHLAFCQLLLIACLVLPFLQPWHRALELVPEQPRAAAEPVVTTQPLPQPLRQSAFRWEEAALLALAAGAALRALWLAVGLARLRRYRAAATPLYPLPEAIEAARTRIGGEAVVCVSKDVAGPVMFGYLYPVILFPPAVLELPFESQFAIASHEFLHVRRRDWLLTMCEELAGAVLWFHPAVWWLLGQIRLAREQVVDREAVALTAARDPYVNALLSMSMARPRFDLAPAPLFLRKRHLTQRIHSLLKEVSMSKRRLVSSYVSIAAVLAIAVWGAAVLFPLNGATQVQIQQTNFNDPSGVTVEPGGKLLHRSPVRYPAEAQARRIEGTIVVSLTVNAGGTVTDVRVVSGPDELRRSVLESALQWHYLNEAGSPATAKATIEFRLPQDSVPAVPSTPPPPAPPAGAPKAPQTARGVLESIDVSALPEPLQGMVREKTRVFQGRELSPELVREVISAAMQVDSHLAVAMSRTAATPPGATVAFRLNDSSAAAVPLTAPTAQTNFASTPGVQRINVDGDVQQRKLISMVRPSYPPKAREARAQGIVRLAVLIGTDGHVASMQLVSGHPLLATAAQESVAQWVYQPSLVDGQPVEVLTQTDLNFTLQ